MILKGNSRGSVICFILNFLNGTLHVGFQRLHRALRPMQRAGRLRSHDQIGDAGVDIFDGIANICEPFAHFNGIVLLEPLRDFIKFGDKCITIIASLELESNKFNASHVTRLRRLLQMIGKGRCSCAREKLKKPHSKPFVVLVVLGEAQALGNIIL